MVKFGLMVQVTDLWQFLLFRSRSDHHAVLKLQWPKYAEPVGTAYRLYGLPFIAVTNPPVYDYAAFSMII